MRRGRLATVFAMLVLAAPGAALAASPQDIADDLADGRLDGTYTAAELQRAMSDPSLQGYLAETSQQVLGAQRASGGPGAGGGAPAAGEQQFLPFTGAELGVYAALGVALLGGGLLLRRVARSTS